MGVAVLSGKPDEMPGGNFRWTGIPSRGVRNTYNHFTLIKTGMSHVAWVQTFMSLFHCFLCPQGGHQVQS